MMLLIIIVSILGIMILVGSYSEKDSGIYRLITSLLGAILIIFAIIGLWFLIHCYPMY